MAAARRLMASSLRGTTIADAGRPFSTSTNFDVPAPAVAGAAPVGSTPSITHDGKTANERISARTELLLGVGL
jgi:hypothetical protein